MYLYNPTKSYPISQFFVDMLLILGEAIFKDRYPGEHYTYKHAEQSGGLHVANGLNGNIGRLAFEDSHGKVHGLGWVAPSTKAAVRMVKNAEAYSDRTVVILPTRNRKNRRIKAINNTNVRIVDPFFKSKRRTHDSEYLLLNYLHDFLCKNSKDIKGELVVVTERVPCDSCTHIISNFSNEFTNIKISIVYFYETEGRESKLLLSAFPQNVRVYKASMSARGAQAVQILGSTPVHLIQKRVLEQSEKIDSSAHIGSRVPGIQISVPSPNV